MVGSKAYSSGNKCPTTSNDGSNSARGIYRTDHRRGKKVGINGGRVQYENKTLLKKPLRADPTSLRCPGNEKCCQQRNLYGACALSISQCYRLDRARIEPFRRCVRHVYKTRVKIAIQRKIERLLTRIVSTVQTCFFKRHEMSLNPRSIGRVSRAERKQRFGLSSAVSQISRRNSQQPRAVISELRV